MDKHPFENQTTILTIGHCTRTFETFVNILQAHTAVKVVDIRTVPRSRQNPQFNRETLPADLKALSIGYIHMAGLGGLRRPQIASQNSGWRNLLFRGFADYMQTQEFEKNLQTLIALALQERVALMCSEAVPWRCHRSLIADALLVRGIKVEYILNRTILQPHKLTSWAQVDGLRVTYPKPSL